MHRHTGKTMIDRRRWSKRMILRSFCIRVFFFFYSVLYVKASSWDNVIRRIQEAGGKMSFEDVDEDASSPLKNGSKVEPVSRKEPWYTLVSLWSRSLIASFVSLSSLRSPSFFECFGRSISEINEIILSWINKIFHFSRFYWTGRS